MRKSQLSAIVALIVLASAAAVAWAAKPKASVATYTPPAEVGLIYTVINFSRTAGRAQHTLVSVDRGDFHNDFVVPPPYTSNPCSTSTPAGFVYRLRNNQGDSTPVTLTTNGTIVRGPFQGDVPMELLHACYRLVK
ncbi:MAG TPA: hypothetical protein VGS07_14095 [Thermoanaerobaculia bacterium]|jgi:hypothetical protein|nr:hypothetical protein [Thermoanaerobaculia bacterium]